jgi:hypothetical protein
MNRKNSFMRIGFSNSAKFVFAAGIFASSQPLLHAQDDVVGDRPGWFVRADAVARFNLSASLQARNPVLPPGNYNDGFVLPGKGGAISGRTPFWGYNNPAQVVGDNMEFHRYDNVPSQGDRDLNLDSPTFGGELVGGYRFTGFKVFNRPARVGIEIGYGYSQLSQSMDFSSSGMASYTVDTYPLDGVIPPQAPYSGPFDQPGPLLGLNSNSSTTSASPATSLLRGKLETTLQNVRVGPSFELEVAKNFNMGVGFGYSSMYVDASLNYTEVTTFTNPGIPTINSGNVNIDKAEWEPGIYFELRGEYQFSRYVGAFLGGDYQYNRAFELGDDTHEVKIDLGSTYAAKAGMVIRF